MYAELSELAGLHFSALHPQHLELSIGMAVAARQWGCFKGITRSCVSSILLMGGCNKKALGADLLHSCVCCKPNIHKEISKLGSNKRLANWSNHQHNKVLQHNKCIVNDSLFYIGK